MTGRRCRKEPRQWKETRQLLIGALGDPACWRKQKSSVYLRVDGDSRDGKSSEVELHDACGYLDGYLEGRSVSDGGGGKGLM